MREKLVQMQDLKTAINIQDEISPLKRVLLHRPDGELLNLVPDYLPEMLFDDIPWLEKAQEEHDEFAKVLKNNGVEVVYLKQLLTEALASEQAKKEFICKYVEEARIYTSSARAAVCDYLRSLPQAQMIDKAMSGIRKKDFPFIARHLSNLLEQDYPFITAPMPNLYFTRDPFAFVGNGVIACRMHTHQRRRETLFGEMLFKYHPSYCNLPRYYDRNNPFSIEGGDVLVLGNGVLAVGISQRSQADGVEKLARTLLLDQNSGFNTVLAIDIPKTRSFMHLDTVFTCVDDGKFTVHPVISQQFTTFTLQCKKGEIVIDQQTGKLDDILKKVLNKSQITLIKCGGDSFIDSSREQWNDGANTLAIGKGEVVVYARNTVTNQLLRDNGIITHEIPCSELSRGRGGPRCMSMPMLRLK